MSASTQKGQGSSIEIELIQEIEAIEKLSGQWNSLVTGQSFKTIYQTWGFHKSWWHAFGKDYRPFVLVVKRNSAVVTIVPLVKTNESGGKIIQFWGSPNFDYHDIIGESSPEIIRTVLLYLKQIKSDWTTIQFDQISKRSGTLVTLEAEADELGLTWIKRETDRCYFFEYDGPPDKHAEFTLHKGRNYKKAVNHFNRMGGFELRRIDDLIEAQGLLQHLFHLHIDRWKGTPSPSKFCTSDNRVFYLDLLRNLWSENHICMMLLSVDRVPVACALNFEQDGTIFHYTLSYSSFFTKRSPGAFFVTLQSETLVRIGMKLDFCRGSQDYKEEIASDSFGNLQFQIYSSSASALLDRLYEWIKHSGPLRKLLSNPNFMKKKYAFDALAMRYGKLGALFRLFSSTPSEAPESIAKLYRLTSKIVPIDEANKYQCFEAKPTDEFMLASFLDIVDESAELDQLRERFRAGDRYFGVRWGDVLLAVARLTSTGSDTPLPVSFVLPNNLTSLVADIAVVETELELELTQKLLAYICGQTSENELYLLLDAFRANHSVIVSKLRLEASR